MRFTAINTASPALKKLKNGIPSRQHMTEVGNMARALITQRTLLGRDEHGNNFKPYSKRTYYAPTKNRPPGYPAPSGGRTTHKRFPKTKLKTMAFDDGYAGYKAGIGRPSHVTLAVSGQMLADMVTQVPNKRTAIILFRDRKSAAKAHKHHTGRYPFFGVSTSDVSVMRKQFVRFMMQTIKKAGL